MTSEMYRDPKKLVEDISALGLRHVGYGIPTEFFAPFVSSAVEAVKSIDPEEHHLAPSVYYDVCQYVILMIYVFIMAALYIDFKGL